MNIIYLLLTAFSIYSLPAIAKDVVGGNPTHQERGSLTVDPSNKRFLSPRLQYPLSPDGIRHYLSNEVNPDDSDFRRLDSIASQLESRQAAANILGGTTMVIGGILTLHGLGLLEEESFTYFSGTEVKYGLGTFAVGYLLYDLLSPDTSDMRKFIREHNKALAQHPHSASIAWSKPRLDLFTSQQGAGFSLAVSF